MMLADTAAATLLARALPWVLLNAAVCVLLVLDLCVFHRKAHVIQVREAAWWTVFWVGLGLSFAAVMYAWRSADDAFKYLAGYTMEIGLSADNLFVFLMLFAYFRVPPEHQHRVLFWGILGAIVMRIVFILLGTALINRLQWVMFIFAAFLILTGLKMMLKGDEEVHPERNPFLRLCKRLLPLTPEYRGGRFFVRDAGRLLATPLFIVLVVVETTDVAFAVDSVPAVIGVIRDKAGHSDPFIAYSSNIFAILGLRAMFFALAGLMRLFHLLHYGLAFILVFVGGKMLVEASGEYGLIRPVHVPAALSLGVIGAVLALSVAASILLAKPAAAPKPPGE